MVKFYENEFFKLENSGDGVLKELEKIVCELDGF